ncbi:MAG: hypothetical protein OEZ10_12800 [Gammaproteobacteria bacterium]|nr:hypothetical protein [Gammaproteobacteria bacterium]
MLQQNKIQDTVEKLKTQRDELIVQINLAKAETRDEWEKMEKRWHEIDQKIKTVGKEAREASEDVVSALGLLADEVADAYKRIKSQL